MTSLTGALTALALNLSRNPFAATEIMFWLMGSLADRSIVHVALAAALIVPGAALLLSLGRALEALTLGEEAAASLGEESQQIKRIKARQKVVMTSAPGGKEAQSATSDAAASSDLCHA